MTVPARTGPSARSAPHWWSESPTTGACIAWRTVIATIATVLLVAGAAAPGGARDEREETTRLAGEDRVATAVELARAAFPDGTDTAVLARRDAFPDALAASGLAGAADAAVLLTARDRLSGATASALQDLGVTDVTLVGGTSAISAAVEDQVRGDGHAVRRVAGADRYATARQVARAMADDVGGIEGRGERVAVLADGATFADALAAGPIAYARHLPVLLTTGQGLHPDAAAALDELQVDHVVVVGGSAAVPRDVADDLEARGIDHDRVAGRDRTETAAELATWAVRHAGFDTTEVVAARGDAFPDALAAAPLAGGNQYPLLLTRAPATPGYDLLQWMVDHSDGTRAAAAIERVTALGGTDAVTAAALEQLAEAAAPPERVMTYAIGSRGDVTADLAWFAEHVDWTLTDPRGWALGHDVRWDLVADADAADLTILLATPAAVAAAADGCSASWSCQPAGTDEVYVNEDNWMHATASYRQAGRTLDAYRHYVVLHEVGHAPPMDFGHLRCEDVYAAPRGEPAPVMEQQSIEAAPCRTRVWPLQFERDQARDRLIGGGSTLTDPDDTTHAP